MKYLMVLFLLVTMSGCATMGGALQGFGQGMQRGINQGGQSLRCVSNNIGFNTYTNCR